MLSLLVPRQWSRFLANAATTKMKVNWPFSNKRFALKEIRKTERRATNSATSARKLSDPLHHFSFLDKLISSKIITFTLFFYYNYYLVK